jgi:hypothetical protein
MSGNSKLRTAPNSPPAGTAREEDTTAVGATSTAPDTVGATSTAPDTVGATSQRESPTEHLPAMVSPVLETNLDQGII